jgi:hypothetical protein
VLILLVYVVTTSAYICFYGLVYSKVIDLERYRVMAQKWPWEREDWADLKRRTLTVVGINDILLAQGMLFLGRRVPSYRVDAESFPDFL